MNINHISISRSKTFKECRRKYLYQYHLKTPSPEPEPAFFTFGKIVHKIAEEYVRTRGAKPYSVLWEDIKAGRLEIDEGADAPQLTKDQLRRLLKHLKFLQKLNNRIGRDGIVEYGFKYDLDPPNGRNVVGFIDRLILSADQAFILDYKTTKPGKFRCTRKQAPFDPQLRTYARVVQKEFGIPSHKIAAAFYYLEDGELIATNFTDELLEHNESSLRELYFQIENADPNNVVGTPGEYCRFCNYRSLCPESRFRNSQKEISYPKNFAHLIPQTQRASGEGT